MRALLLAFVSCSVIAMGGVPEKLDVIGKAAFDQNRAAGFSLVVALKGKTAIAKGYGMADIDRKNEVTPDTQFSVGSISKQFTAAAILLLKEQGKLTLEDKLSKYLPQLPKADKITLRMMLNQTSGLHNFPNMMEHKWPLQGVIPPEKLFEIMATDTSDFDPGTKWAYSNTNYAALARIVEKVSGMTYAEFLKKNIFGPLEMASSGSGYGAQAGAATPYYGKGKFHKQFGLSVDLFYGAGGVVSTAADLAKWDEALTSGKLLNEESMKDMWHPGKLADGTPVHYAMGFLPEEIDGHKEVWHNGYAPGAGGYCYNAIFPDDRLSVIVLSNATDNDFRNVPEDIVKQTLRAYFPHE